MKSVQKSGKWQDCKVNPMQSGMASGSSEIVMCINVVAHREAKLPHGEDNSPKRPAGGMAASRGGQLTQRKKAHRGHGCLTGRTTTKRPTGGKNALLGGHTSTPTEGKNACNGGAKACEKCTTGRTPIDDPQGQKCL